MPQAEPKLSVFTVDDSEIVYKNMGLLLAENKNINWLGHAYTLEDAHSQIVDKNPELVILDIHLKDGTSFELLEYIGKELPTIIVIMFTNLSTDPYRKKCEKLGAKFFLDKSAEFEKIPKILEEVLQSK